MFVKILILSLAVSVVYAGPKIIRPCALNDYKCLGDNFAANSQCNRNVQGSIARQFYVDEFRFETPYFNSSYIDNNLVLTNLDACYVSEFFFNMDSDTSVITVDCPNLELQSQRTLIRHQSQAEDQYFYFNNRALYPLVRFTMNIKHANSMDVCSAFTFADVTALPRFIVDPTDNPSKNFLSTDLSFMNIYERENFAYRAGPILKLFIDSYICNFACVP